MGKKTEGKNGNENCFNVNEIETEIKEDRRDKNIEK
jgi:hypothetical protein